MRIRLREPVNGLTHLFGAIMSVIGLVFLVYYAAKTATAWHVVAFSIYGASLILLYTASTLYHLLPLSEKGVKIFRRIDHMMIYVLIAGTYTPICLIPLRGIWGYSFLVSVWGVAVVGIILKVLWFNAPRWLYTLNYVVMGAAIIFALKPLSQAIHINAIIWMIAGGFFYIVGAAIYATKWPKIPLKHFSYHEIFHIFILLGSFSHFMIMYKYVMNV